MAKMICIYWRDIPAQVVVRVGRSNHKQELHERFARAIDRAAMRAGRGSSDAYLDDWRRESTAVQGEAGQLLADKVAELEAQFSAEYLEKVVKASGLTSEVKPD